MYIKKTFVLLFVLGGLLLLPRPVFAMHIMEGFLPAKWCLIWYALSLPFVVAGVVSISKRVAKNPELKLLLGVAGAFAFVLSALKIPSVTGSSSHPTGTGLGAVLFGPFAMSVIGCIVLIFQAVLMAHGGISTLGANTFSMAVVGPIAAFLVFRLVKKFGFSNGVAVFSAAALGDLLTYITTAFQLALAYPMEYGGFIASFGKFLTIFGLTQIPLAVSEGLLTAVIFNFLATYSKNELSLLGIYFGKEKRGMSS